MKVYTSYFANAKNFPEDMIPLTICRSNPYWCKWRNFNTLAPTKEILDKYKQDHDENSYTYDFIMGVLYKLSPVLTYTALCVIAETEHKSGVILVCYEAPGKFCHRNLVRDWFITNGFEVEELKNKKGLL